MKAAIIILSGAKAGEEALADVFGAREEAEKSGVELITDKQVPGNSGLSRIARMAADGYAAFTF